MLPRARPERFPWFQCAGAFRRTTAPVIHPMGASSRTLARIGIALDIPCGIALRPLLKLLHQTLQQPRARFDRGEQHVFMISMCAVAIHAKPVQGWGAAVAILTVAAMRVPRRDDVIALFQLPHGGTHFLDHACGSWPSTIGIG